MQVVPLSQRSGVLEWCTGTVPIGEFLVNNENGAHKRYRPEDLSALHCQKKMMVSDTQKFKLFQNYVPAATADSYQMLRVHDASASSADDPKKAHSPA